MRYCSRCVLPDTRPHLEFDIEGICVACRRHENRGEINWVQRADSFAALVASVQGLGRDYDCVVPVSGGKDSTWQTSVCLEYGLKPLAVTWRSPGRTLVGQRNLDNLRRLGVDHIDFSIDPDVERRFMRKTFTTLGSPAIPMHLAIFAIPLRIAVAFDIPLVVWGENSAMEYGGRDEDALKGVLDANWVARYGVTQGTVADDWVDSDLSSEDLRAYTPPSEALLSQASTHGVFLGHYFPWDPQATKDMAVARGFTTSTDGPRTGLYDYADIDDDFISIHHWMKWYKFGFTRTFDNLSLEIRNGRVTREQAVEHIRQRGDETPWSDLGKLATFFGCSVDELLKTAHEFRNLDIWKREPNGTWHMSDFLVPDWNWSAPTRAQGSQ